MGTSCPQASSSKDSRHKRKDPCDGKVLVAASEEDEAGSRIGKAQLAAPFVVVHIAAAAVDAAFSESWQGRVFVGHIGVSFADTGMKSDLSLLLRCTVPTDDDSQTWAAPSLLVERLPSVASRSLGVRLDLADASIPGETDLGRPIVRGKDV